MKLLSVVGLVVLAGSLQGCFPIVAAGVGTSVMMAQDPRSSGTQIDDQSIELKAAKSIGDKYRDKVHASITSYNRIALITGEVPDETTKTDIGKMVATTENVLKVHNELAISGLSSFTSRSSDTFVTSDIKRRYLLKDNFDSSRIKVVTENGTVYLMGLVSRAEAATAGDIASSTSGVLRVVTLFEYTN